MKRYSSTRRQFLEQVAAVGATGVAGGCARLGSATEPTAAPVLVARNQVSRRMLGANDRIQCGFIGIGNRGASLLGSVLERDDVDVVAVTDIHDAALAKAAENCRKQYADVRSYGVFEEMIEKERLDAVVIATPDHIHTPAILNALDAGLDVYTEKPMTLTWVQAQQVRDRARETGAVVQVGTQLRSMTMYQKAREAVQSGVIGKLVAVQVHRHAGGSGSHRKREPVTEADVRWDLFLRDTKHYPFDPQRFLNWRRYVEYSNGAAGDLLMHHLDIFHFITRCGMPERVMSVGGLYEMKDGRTCPDTIAVLLEYPEKFLFTYTTTYVNDKFGLNERYIGSAGVLEVREMDEMSIWRGDQEEIVPSAGVLNGPHLENFFECMRTREQTIAPVEAGCMGATCCHMAVLSEQSGESVKWDAALGKVV